MPEHYTSDLLYWFDLFGTVVFAISGGLAAARQRMDLFGFIVVAMMPAIGGGSIRDVLLNAPAFWISRPDYILLCIVTAIITFIAAHRIASRFRALLLVDAIGLAAFTIIGTQKALNLGASPLIAIMMGIVTSVAGGILRDLLCGEVPLVLRKEIYAVAALVGSCVYWGIIRLGAMDLAVYVSFFVTLAIRLLAIRFRLALPSFTGPPPS